MHTPRFIVPALVTECQISPSPGENSPVGKRVSLNKEQSRHLLKVLRRSPGDRVELFLESPLQLLRAVLVHSSGNKAVLEISEVLPLPHKPFSLTLLVGAPKPKQMEFVIKRCIEAGATSICFFNAENSSGFSQATKRPENPLSLRSYSKQRSRAVPSRMRPRINILPFPKRRFREISLFS